MAAFREPLLVLVFLLTGPLVLTLLHELSHVLVGLFVQRGGVWMTLGSGRQSRTFTLGRLTVAVNGRFWFVTGRMGFTESGPGRAGLLATQAAGPLASVMLAALLSLVMWLSPVGFGSRLLQSYAGWAALQAVFTALPVVYPRSMGGLGGMPSDGLQFVRTLRSRMLP